MPRPPDGHQFELGQSFKISVVALPFGTTYRVRATVVALAPGRCAPFDEIVLAFRIPGSDDSLPQHRRLYRCALARCLRFASPPP